MSIITRFIRTPFIAAAFLCAGITAAEAHVKFLSSQPAKDAVGPSPAEITLTFDHATTPVSAKLKDAAGADIAALGPVRADGVTLHYPVNRALSAGKYELTYRATSEDAHVVTGIVAFTVVENAGK